MKKCPNCNNKLIEVVNKVLNVDLGLDFVHEEE